MMERVSTEPVEITSVDALREIVGHPVSAVANKVGDRLLDVHRQWVSNSPLCFVATTDTDGRVDVSPKGDPPGFVHIIDATTIAIPERPGNKRVDGYLNVLTNPHVGTIFVVPGRGDTLRINGRARILSDADYFDELAVKGKRPILALEMQVDEVFFHCSKAFLRSNAWKPETWTPDAVPSTAVLAKSFKAEQSLEELEAYYSEENYRTMLY
jgi:PPOX class probable FMN-dependent enzyme